MNDIWFQIALTFGTSLFTSVAGVMYGVRRARASERRAGAAEKNADSRAEMVAISGLEALAQALEKRLAAVEHELLMCKKQHIEQGTEIATLKLQNANQAAEIAGLKAQIGRGEQ